MSSITSGTKRRKTAHDVEAVPKLKSKSKGEKPQRQPSPSPSPSASDDENEEQSGVEEVQEQEAKHDGAEAVQKTFKDLVCLRHVLAPNDTSNRTLKLLNRASSTPSAKPAPL